MADLVEDIKSRRISEVIRHFARLQNAGGAKKKCRCPFHHEKTPSFFLDDAQGYFHCFGCGEGGDVITFIQKIKNCDFLQATDILCEMLGIDKTQYEKKNIQQIEKQASFFSTMDVVSKYYQQSLKEDQNALNYVSVIRNLTQKTIQTFGIGLANNNIQELMQYCQNNNINKDALLQSGILKTGNNPTNDIDETINNQNSYEYLFFRDRITIPIHNTSGKIVAFGGRTYLSDDKGAKYINSAENDNFKKSNILFNLNRAKMEIDTNNPLIIVEGYMDVITLWQYGFTTAVAPLGTSITEKHLKTILNFCKNPIFVFDADLAGQKASLRACEMIFSILQTGIIPRFCTLQGAKDVDEFLTKYSVNDLQQQLASSPEINVFLWNCKQNKYNISNPNEIAKLQQEINDCISKIPDKTLRHHYTRYFNNEIWLLSSTKVHYQQNKQLQLLKTKGNNYNNNIDTIEKQIIAILLTNEDYLEDDIFMNNIVGRFNEKNKNILKNLLDKNDQNKDQLEREKKNFLNKHSRNKILQNDSQNEDTKQTLDNLTIVWELEFLKNSNLPQNIKTMEIKKVLEKKRKQFIDFVIKEHNESKD